MLDISIGFPFFILLNTAIAAADSTAIEPINAASFLFFEDFEDDNSTVSFSCFIIYGAVLLFL